MKPLILFLLIILITSCVNNPPQKKYHDFTYEFRDKQKDWHWGDKINSWLKDGRKFNFAPYNNLVKDSTKNSINLKGNLTSLGRFVGVTSLSKFDLFLVKKDSQYIFIVGNKLNKNK